MESKLVEVNSSDLKYIDEDNTSQQCLDVSTNIELSGKCGDIVVIVNNVSEERDSAREEQVENIAVRTSRKHSASNDNVGEEQIAMLNNGDETVASEQQVTKCWGSLLRFQTNITEEQADGFSELGRVWMYLTLVITMVFGVADVGTDVLLMFKYFQSRQYLYGTLTMVFVWVPALNNIYWLYFICGLHNNTCLYQIRKNKWLLIILYIVPIASVVVALNNFILLWKRKMKKEDCRDKTENLLVLQIYDSYLEALPQLTLQLFIVLNNVDQETQDTNMLRWCSMALSAFTVARVQYSHATRNADNIGVVEAAAQFINTMFLVVSRVFVLSMGFTVSPTVTGVCLLLHSSVVAVAWYRRYREKQCTVTTSIIGSAADATRDIFYYNWFFPNPVIYRMLSRRMFTYTMYTLQCVLFTTLWCVLESNTHGTVWYYVVPAVPVLLSILYVPLVWLQIYFNNNHIAAW